MKTFFLNDLNNNAGDTLSKPILEFFGVDVKLVDRNEQGKLLAVGSVISALRKNDVVWGTGAMRDKKIVAPAGVRFLAVRGPKTRALISGAQVPEVYGDPAILLPLIYQPKVEKTHVVGYLPHYVDKQIVMTKYAVAPGISKIIDIQTPWQNVVKEVLSCEKIISSSLHGIIIAEAYGIPVVWEKYSDGIIGGDFKFQDYFLGTGRSEQKKGEVLPPLNNLFWLQTQLLNALKQL